MSAEKPNEYTDSALSEEMGAVKEFRNEIDRFGENFKIVSNLLSKMPKWISTEHYKKLLINIDFSNDNVINLLKQVPEKERSTLLFRAATLKVRFGGKITDIEAIQYARMGTKESDIFLETLKAEENLDNFNILNTMFKAIDEGKDPFEGLHIPSEVIFFNEDIINSIDNENGILFFDRLPPDTQEILLSGIERKYKDILENLITKTPGLSTNSLFNNEKILRIYVKYYNVQHYWGDTINYESISYQNKLDLRKHFNATLFKLGWKVDNVDTNILNELEKRDKRIREENQKRIQFFKQKNKEINEKSKSGSTTIEKPVNKTNNKNINIQNANGVDIAENVGLGKKLTEQYKNENIPEIPNINEDAFSIARGRFIEQHKELKEYLTISTLESIYDKENNYIKRLDNSSRDWLKKIFKDTPDELTKIYNLLLSFPNEVNNVKEELYDNSNFLKLIEDENKNNYVIGNIIDNVRNIFDNASKKFEGNLGNKGLKLKGQEPIKIEGDYLKILGEFNGSDVIVRYNLKSGTIFMNSFLQYKNQYNIVLGDDSLANNLVGQLASFEDILSNNKSVTNESLNSQINLLSDIIVDNSKKQSGINSIIVKFLKTFNIVSNNQEIKNIEINSGSNLFDLLQILSNSSPRDVENFQIFMEKIMNYSGLEWGKNNLYGSKFVFNENTDNKNISILNDNANKFSNNPNIFKDKINFDSSCQIGFAQMVIENITDDVRNKPNRKLDGTKMHKFFIDAGLDSPFG